MFSAAFKKPITIVFGLWGFVLVSAHPEEDIDIGICYKFFLWVMTETLVREWGSKTGKGRQQAKGALSSQLPHWLSRT